VPQPSLIAPSGSEPTGVFTSAPSAVRMRVAVRVVAPFAQSTTSRRPFSGPPADTRTTAAVT
jgi:hypothetical protein